MKKKKITKKNEKLSNSQYLAIYRGFRIIVTVFLLPVIAWIVELLFYSYICIKKQKPGNLVFTLWIIYIIDEEKRLTLRPCSLFEI